MPCAANTRAQNSLGIRAEYDVQANINWAKGLLNVSSTAHVDEHVVARGERITFDLLPLFTTGSLQGLTVSAGGQKVTAAARDMTVLVPLP